jgi:hypothetical protein
MFPAIDLDPASTVVPVGAEPSTTDRPLATFINATQDAVQEVLDVTEPETCYMVIARLSGHLAAMWRAIYPHAGSRLGADGQLRAACLRRARTVGWTLRLLECRLSGESSAMGLPVQDVSAMLTEHLRSYQSAERALVTWLEDQLPAEGRDRLALGYRRALTCAPTRPHPRCPRTGPLCGAAFWLYGRWDRLLDTMDARPGVGRGFSVLTSRQDTTSDGARRPE